MELDDLKYAQRERIVHLDRCFTWRGVANRRDLIDRFGISTAQAALDFRVYLDLTRAAPPVYDGANKTYVAAADHEPLVPSSQMDAFGVLDTVADDGVPAMLPSLPSRMDRAPIIHLHAAILAREALHVRYTSISSGRDEARWITPTRFTSDGKTVHVRVFCHHHDAYRFYLPIRIDLASSFERRSLTDPLPPDEDWHTRAIIRLRPKIDLSPKQAAIVRHEYGFDGEYLIIETRKALRFFTARRWGLDEPGSRLEQVSIEHEPILENQNRSPI